MLFCTSYAMAIHLAGLTHQYISWLYDNVPLCRTARHEIRATWNADAATIISWYSIHF